MNKLVRNVRGDTIIEVLLAMTVLSLILSASYTLANRSSQSLRQSQERSEGLKIAEAQLESLKSFLATPGTALPSDQSIPFCMNGNTTAQDAGFTSIPADPQADPLNNYPAACTVNGIGDEERYNVVILRPSSAPYTFVATVRWARVNGDGIDQAQVYYRVYPESITDSIGTPDAIAQCPPGQFDPTGLGGACFSCNAPPPVGFGGGYRSPEGAIGRDSCEPIPPRVQFVVNKLAGSCAGARQNRHGATVSVSGNDHHGNPISPEQTGTDSSVRFDEMAFGRTYNATLSAIPPGTNPTSQAQPYVESRPNSPYVGTSYTTYSPNGGAAYSVCTGSTSVTTPGPAPAGRDTTTVNNALTFRSNCYVRSVWVYENNPATYYRDTTRDPIYAWGVGARSGPDGYKPGHWEWNGHNPAAMNANDLRFPDWVEQPASGFGHAYYFHHNGNGSTGGHWYNMWQWNRYFTGNYGPPYEVGNPYYHGQHWVEHRDASATCP